MMNPDLLPEGADEELLKIYKDSARKTVEQLSRAADAAGPDELRQHLSLLHRLAHNLKGSSCQFGFVEIGKLAQALEQLAARLERAERAPEEDEIRALKAAVAALRGQIENLACGSGQAGERHATGEGSR